MSRFAEFEVIPPSPTSRIHLAVSLRRPYSTPRGAIALVRAYDREMTEIPGAPSGWPLSRIADGHTAYLPVEETATTVTLPPHEIDGYSVRMIVRVQGFQDPDFDPDIVTTLAFLALDHTGRRSIVSSHLPRGDRG